MTDIDIPTLKAAAEKASKTAPGQWRDDGYRIYDSRENQNCIFEYKHEPRHTDDGDWDTYRFIALANPATVLALIERLERAELAENNAEFWKQRCEDVPCVVEEHVGMRARLEKLEAVAEAASPFASSNAGGLEARLAQALAALEAP